MPGLSVIEANKILDFVLGSGAPATVWIALCTVLPTSLDSGSTIVEPTASQWGGYARVAVANDPSHWPAASGGIKSNGALITFPASTGGTAAPVTCVAVAILDAATAGNIITSGPLNFPISVVSTNAPTYGVGAFTFSVG